MTLVVFDTAFIDRTFRADDDLLRAVGGLWLEDQDAQVGATSSANWVAGSANRSDWQGA
jgi:hypothetical protein